MYLTTFSMLNKCQAFRFSPDPNALVYLKISHDKATSDGNTTERIKPSHNVFYTIS
jgi:hypothetical protein